MDIFRKIRKTKLFHTLFDDNFIFLWFMKCKKSNNSFYFEIGSIAYLFAKKIFSLPQKLLIYLNILEHALGLFVPKSKNYRNREQISESCRKVSQER